VSNLPFSKGFRRLTIIASGCALFLVVAGATDRATYPASGCLDWPWCYGLRFSQATPWLALVYLSLSIVYILLTLAIALATWRDYRRYSLMLALALGGVAAAGAQMIGVASLAWFSHHPLGVMAYLLTMAACLALSLSVTTITYLPTNSLENAGVFGQSQRFYLRWLLGTGGAMLLLLMTGVIVTGTDAGLACPDWPLCQGEIFPVNFSLKVAIHLIHRFTVVAVGVAVAAIVLQTRRRYLQYPLLVKGSTTLGFLFLAQVGLGGLNVVLRLPNLVSLAHLTLAMAIWGSLVILTVIFYLTAKSLPADPEPVEATPLNPSQKAAIYFKLTKPWILVLLLITTAGAMFIAAEGVPPISLILYTLLGGALAASGASVLNSYIDSDIDQLMSRTSRRPTVTGLVTPQETLFFGLALSTFSFLVLALFVNPLSAGLSTLGILYYVFFYTLYLKRATMHNIIIGGAAGAIPPLVGWTAVTNTLDLGALYLFAIIFFWTPPHTWALALLVKKDYANARVPMLPVIVGDKETSYHIFLYSLLLITLTLLPFAAHMMSWLYLLGVVVLGLPFLYLAWRLWQNYSKSTSKKLYKFSQFYLALLFLMMALDRML
jgi:protoheme IX farnesyltransferase